MKQQQKKTPYDSRLEIILLWKIAQESGEEKIA